MTTILEWQQYISDNSADFVDGKFSRTSLRMLNAALRKISEDGPSWSHYKEFARVNLVVGEDFTTAAITLGGTTLTVAVTETLLAKYVTEEWDLLFDDEASLTFRLASLTDAQTVELLSGQQWLNATITAGNLAFVRSLYDLPGVPERVEEVRLSDSQSELTYLPPADFDRYKAINPPLTGEPLHFTTRGDQIEFWPALASDGSRQAVLISYVRRAPKYTSLDDTSTDVDWDDRFDNLLEAALDVEISNKLRGSSPIGLEAALLTYAQRLSQARASDSSRVETSSTMRLGGRPPLDEARLFRRNSAT